MLDDQIKIKKDAYEELASEVKSLQAKFKDSSSGMTNSEIEADIASLKKDVASLTKQMEPFRQTGRKIITQAEITKAEALLKKC